mmetsp:Transcript_7002/g.22389  ORF Transcript_7002/g.22389 Transcript_7002/m.22389 type:complete len:286 (-) Transcript_7002:438-1295(-)
MVGTTSRCSHTRSRSDGVRPMFARIRSTWPTAFWCGSERLHSCRSCSITGTVPTSTIAAATRGEMSVNISSELRAESSCPRFLVVSRISSATLVRAGKHSDGSASILRYASAARAAMLRSSGWRRYTRDRVRRARSIACRLTTTRTKRTRRRSVMAVSALLAMTAAAARRQLRYVRKRALVCTRRAHWWSLASAARCITLRMACDCLIARATRPALWIAMAAKCRRLSSAKATSDARRRAAACRRVHARAQRRKTRRATSPRAPAWTWTVARTDEAMRRRQTAMR